MVTLDAIHCNRETCHEIVENAGGHYLIGVKDNQKGLLARLQRLFDGEQPQDRHTDRSKGHGRLEQRIVQTLPVERRIDLPHARTAIRICRTRHTVRGGRTIRTTSETAYAVTSIPPDRLTAAHAGHLVRGHWSIENRLHHVKDASLLEDRYRANNGLGRIMAAIRSIVVLVLAPSKATVVVAMRTLAGNLHKAVRLMTCNSLQAFRLCFLK